MLGLPAATRPNLVLLAGNVHDLCCGALQAPLGAVLCRLHQPRQTIRLRLVQALRQFDHRGGGSVSRGESSGASSAP